MLRSPPDPLYTLKSDLNPVHSVCFWSHEKNEKLFAGCQSGQVQLWSLQSNRSVEGLQAHPGPCLNVGCYGVNLITQGKGDGNVKSWHPLEGGGWAPNYTIHTKHSVFCRFSMLNNGDEASSMLICPDEDYSVGVYSAFSGEKLTDLKMDDFEANRKSLGYVMALKSFLDPSTNKPMLLVAHEAGQISLRDLYSAGMEVCRISVGEPIISLEYDPLEGVGVYGTPESTCIRKFRIDTKTGDAELGSQTAITNPGISCVQLRPDSKLLAAGGWDGRLRIFSWQRSPKESEKPNNKDLSVHNSQDLKTSEDGSDTSKGHVNSSSDENVVTKVPPFKKAMKPLAVLKHHSKSIQDVAFSNGPVESWNCSCLIAAGSDD
ncbi:hypothetical protein J437_LFUL013853, partial [Ladona fulva]